MKIIPVIAALLFIFLTEASGQFYYGGLSGYYEFPATGYTLDSAGNIRYQKGDMGFALQAGAMAGSDLRGNSRFGTYVSPMLAYNISSRFRIKAGVTVFQGFGDYYSYGWEGTGYRSNSNPTTTGIFLQGDYILTNKVTLSGAVYKYFSPVNFNDPNKKGPEGESYLFNVNYRPTKHFEINASFEYGNNRNGLFYQDPFYQPGVFGP
jgi:hypothetical protein